MSRLSEVRTFSLEWYRELTDNELNSIVTMELTCSSKNWNLEAFQGNEESRLNMLAVVTERWKRNNDN